MIRHPIFPHIYDAPDPLMWPEYGTYEQRGRTIMWGGHKGEVLAELTDWSVMKCSPCNFMHVVPLPEQAWLDDYYREQFYTQSHPDYVERYERDREWWSLHHAYTVQRMRQLAGNASSERETILDIGSGPGLFLDVARDAGMITYGMELDRHLVQQTIQRGHMVSSIGIADDPLQRLPAFRHSFDSINMHEVLEHMRAPEAVLLNVYEMLKPGGILHIVVPNDFNPLQIAAINSYNDNRVSRLDLWWVAPPEHLNYFSPVSLKLLLNRCGFQPVEMHGTFPMESFMFPFWHPVTRHLNNPTRHPVVYVGNDRLGRFCHQERIRFEIIEAKRQGMYGLISCYEQRLREHRIGREISVFARKQS